MFYRLKLRLPIKRRIEVSIMKAVSRNDLWLVPLHRPINCYACKPLYLVLLIEKLSLEMRTVHLELSSFRFLKNKNKK